MPRPAVGYAVHDVETEKQVTLHPIRSHLRERWPRWLLGVAVVVHVLMMGSLFWGYLDSLFDDSNIHPQGVDFFSIYEGGRNVLEGRSAYFFDGRDTSVTPYHASYRYIPAFAYGFAAPLNALPAWSAYWAWVAFYELLLVINAYVTWRIAGRGTWGVVAAAMWFVYSPFYLEQYMGQFSFLMATLLLLTGIGLVRGKELFAGLPWVMSLLTKSNSVVLTPLFVRLRWWRSLLAGAALGVLSLLYFIWYPNDFQPFFDENVANVFRGAGNRFFNFSPGDLGGVAFIRNSLMSLDHGTTGVPIVYPAIWVAVVVAASLGATFLSREGDPLALFCIWVSAFFLCYAAWEHHYVMFLPVLVLLTTLRPAARPWAVAVFVWLALPTPYWLLDNVWNTGPLPPPATLLTHQEAWPAWGVVLHHAAKAIPVLVLWGYLVVTQIKSGVTVQPLRLMSRGVSEAVPASGD